MFAVFEDGNFATFELRSGQAEIINIRSTDYLHVAGIFRIGVFIYDQRSYFRIPMHIRRQLAIRQFYARYTANAVAGTLCRKGRAVHNNLRQLTVHQFAEDTVAAAFDFHGQTVVDSQVSGNHHSAVIDAVERNITATDCSQRNRYVGIQGISSGRGALDFAGALDHNSEGIRSALDG